MPLHTLTIKDNLTKINFTDRNSLSRIDYIVIHYFGSIGTAYSVSEFFRNAYRGASAHLNLDESKTVWRSVPDEDIAWHCGADSYVHPKCRNSNSIGIEARPYILDKSQSSSAAYRGWYFGHEVEDNLVELIRYLMELYNIPVENVVRHYDVTGKWCPRPWMGSDTNFYYQTTGNEQWARFKSRLIQNDVEDDDMDSNRFRELMNEYRKGLRDNDCGSWSEVARKWSIDQGLFIGSTLLPTGDPNYMWEDLLTREQAAELLYRFAKLMGKA